MTLDLRTEETLFINLSSSRCGNCGQETLPEGVFHTKISGYGAFAHPPGCMVKWKYVSSDYSDFQGLHKRVREMRPDLEFWF